MISECILFLQNCFCILLAVVPSLTYCADRHDRSSAITFQGSCDMQALEDVHRNVMAHLPMQCDEQKLVVQEQLTLLAQIAQGCMSGA